MTTQHHGSPFDRGHADAYYGRPEDPHYKDNGHRIEKTYMTPAQVDEYYAGYEQAIKYGDQKDWGEES